MNRRIRASSVRPLRATSPTTFAGRPGFVSILPISPHLLQEQFVSFHRTRSITRLECKGETDEFGDTYWSVAVRNNGGSQTCTVKIVGLIWGPISESVTTPILLASEKPKWATNEQLPVESRVILAQEDEHRWFVFRKRGPSFEIGKRRVGKECRSRW